MSAPLRPLPVPTRGRGGAPLKRNQIWQRENAGQWRALADERVRGRPVEEVVSYVDARRGDRSDHAQLDALCHLLALLATDVELEADVARHLLAAGRSILAEQSIDPRRSRVSALWAELESRAADVARRSRDAWSAAWHQQMAALSSDSGELAHEQLELASDLALLAGDAPALLNRLLPAELGALDEGALAVELLVVRARLLRLSGRPREARALLDSANTGFEPDVEWELARCDAVESASLIAMARVLKLRRRIATPEHQLDFWLWAHAVRPKRWRSEALKLSTLRKKVESDPAALSIAKAIGELTVKTTRPLARLRRLGAALRASGDVAGLERELLCWAAAARCLAQAKQPRFAMVATARYRALSRTASADRTDDVLGLLSNLPTFGTGGDRTWDELELSARDRRVPSKVRERYLEAGKVAFDVLRLRLGHLGDDDDWRPDALALVTDHLSHLKGPLMKLGQVLSHYGFGLDDGEREVLASLYDKAPAVDWSEMREVFEADLGRDTRRFAEIDPTPFAAGSIGQVHRGLLRDGREVAVKIQYPGVERALAADMRVLRAMLPVLDRVVPKWNVRSLVGEMRELLAAECDYVAEANNQRHFRALFADDPEVVVPDVIDDCSSRRVLTMELSAGERLSEFAQTASIEDRAIAGGRIARFVVRCAFIERTFHTDPHPGNFLVLPDAVCVVDFGSVKYWGEGEGHGWRDVLLACVRSDTAALERSFVSMGMIRGPVDYEVAMAELQRYTMKWTLRREPTEFTTGDVAAEIGAWLRNPALQNIVIQPVDLYGFRMYWGLFALLAKLGAPIDLNAILDAELANAM